MYTLQNEQLAVAILDPVADQARFGTRYCTGGYIFQVTDPRHGELLTGPTYPESFNWFDGQGIPDAFNLSPLRSLAAPAERALIIGIGQCDLQANTVLEFCSWEIEHTPSWIRMRTTQSFHEHALTLTRTVALQERSLRSSVVVENTGGALLPIRWFPHPFYPHPATPELLRCNLAVTLAENPGYLLQANGFIAVKDWNGQKGHFLALEHHATSNLMLLQRHPKLGMVAGTCSYAPTFFPIWGNQHTFSWEPYLEKTIAPGGSESWWIDYDF
jgi:hypothetical protein